MPSRPDRAVGYVKRSNVRMFLREYAPPSALDQLLEAIDPSSPWYELVEGVKTEICGNTGMLPAQRRLLANIKPE